MNPQPNHLLIAAIAICMTIMNTITSSAIENTDKTLSPYFFIKSEQKGVDQLPLKSTSAEVNIAGVIADVNVTQIYKNEGKVPLEATYVFPASTRAAVYGMTMTIGDRILRAEIQERQEAKKNYEKAKKEGKSASLLQQKRPNVFQMSIANILPGDEIKVELKYTELLIPTETMYEFVYPTVVGPRYSNLPSKDASDQDRFVETPYLKQGESPKHEFDISLYLAAGLPIQQIDCISHKVKIAYDQLKSALVTLDPSEKDSGNRDYVIRYQLSGKQTESGLLLYEGKEENFFLLMAQPPDRVSQNQIPPRDYLFIVDVSGSMYGYPLDISKNLIRDLLVNLKPSDTFNVLLFAGGSTVLADKPVTASASNIKKAINLIDNTQGHGSTEILSALSRALAMPQPRGTSRTIVIVTDGYVSVETETFDLIRNRLNDANIFTFGIGSSVNRYIIEGMARAGLGEAFVITDKSKAANKAERFRKYISSPILTDIKVNFGDFETYDVEPVYIPDVLAQRPVVIFGKWRGNLRGKITVAGLTGQKIYQKKFYVSETKPSPRNKALRYLWARHRISILGDYNRLKKTDARIEQIKKLGLNYNLLTRYTSFVAIDYLVRHHESGKLVKVKHPLPLPKSVANSAVGFHGMLPTLVYSANTVQVPKTGADTSESGDYRLNNSSSLINHSTGTGRQFLRIVRIVLDDNVISTDSVKRQFERHLKTLYSSFNKLFLHDPNKTQSITVRVLVDLDGYIKSASIVKSDFGGTLNKVLIKRIKTWQLKTLSIRKPITVLFQIST